MFATTSGHVHRGSFRELLDSARVAPARPRCIPNALSLRNPVRASDTVLDKVSWVVARMSHDLRPRWSCRCACGKPYRQLAWAVLLVTAICGGRHG